MHSLNSAISLILTFTKKTDDEAKTIQSCLSLDFDHKVTYIKFVATKGIAYREVIKYQDKYDFILMRSFMNDKPLKSLGNIGAVFNE